MRWSAVCLLLLAISCLALQVQPRDVTIEGGAGTDFEQVFTVSNDQGVPVRITVQPHPFSTYLAEHATLSVDAFSLQPQESRNLQIRGTVPVLGPETHVLGYDLLIDGRPSGKLRILMPIEGRPTLEPGMEVQVADAVRDEPVSVHATLLNFGNVIAYYNLSLIIEHDGQQVGTLQYPTAVQVLPGEEERLDLLYTDRLQPGQHIVRLTADVNRERDLSANAAFRVLLEDQEERIEQGDDLTLSFTGTAPTSTVEYVILEDGSEILRDTVVHTGGDLVVPTGDLPTGRYDARVTVTHPQGSDVTRLDIIVEPRRILSWWVFIIVVVGGGLASIGARQLRLVLRLRILLLERRVRSAERQLNALIRRTHEITG